MTDSSPSRKRRHILSSINRDESVSTARMAWDHDGKDASHEQSSRAENSRRNTQNEDQGDDLTRPRRSRLRLKSGKSRRRRSRSRHSNNEKPDGHDGYERHGRREKHESRGDEDKPHSRSSRHHHHRRRHGRRPPTPPNPFEPLPLDPEAAFRESLFDAMADDEGAAYWESVYGQPIHVYANEKSGPTGELEQMTDEEYAAYVRRKMWEKTHAGLLEERAKREERRKQKREEERMARKLQEDMEQSLRRGEERRQRRRWAEEWEKYTRAWASWDGTLDSLAWPVDGRQRKDIVDKDVRSFFLRGLGVEDIGEQAFMAKLKEERVRWHPDKMQQKLRGKVDGEVMKDVTAVFQIVDKLWADMRPKA